MLHFCVQCRCLPCWPCAGGSWPPYALATPHALYTTPHTHAQAKQMHYLVPAAGRLGACLRLLPLHPAALPLPPLLTLNLQHTRPAPAQVQHLVCHHRLYPLQPGSHPHLCRKCGAGKLVMALGSGSLGDVWWLLVTFAATNAAAANSLHWWAVDHRVDHHRLVAGDHACH